MRRFKKQYVEYEGDDIIKDNFPFSGGYYHVSLKKLRELADYPKYITWFWHTIDYIELTNDLGYDVLVLPITWLKYGVVNDLMTDSEGRIIGSNSIRFLGNGDSMKGDENKCIYSGISPNATCSIGFILL